MTTVAGRASLRRTERDATAPDRSTIFNLRIEVLEGRGASQQDRIVHVLDEAGEPVCWCGPYSHAEALACTDLFKSAHDFGL